MVTLKKQTKINHDICFPTNPILNKGNIKKSTKKIKEPTTKIKTYRVWRVNPPNLGQYFKPVNGSWILFWFFKIF